MLLTILGLMMLAPVLAGVFVVCVVLGGTALEKMGINTFHLVFPNNGRNTMENVQGLADISLFEQNTGQASRPSGQAVFNYSFDPSSGYTDMRGLTAYNPQSDLESLDTQLQQLQMHARWEKIDSTTTRFLNDLANYDQSKYGEKLAEHEQFVSDMGRLFLRGVKNINKRIEVGYEKMERPDVNVDPAYRNAFNEKVREVRDFLASIGR